MNEGNKNSPIVYPKNYKENDVTQEELEKAKKEFFETGGKITMIDTVANAECYFTVAKESISTMRILVR